MLNTLLPQLTPTTIVLRKDFVERGNLSNSRSSVRSAQSD